MSSTLVIGAGISGLACAHALLRAGRDVRVLEAGTRAGGQLETVPHEGFRLERGPETFPGPARALRELCRELGLPLHEAAPEAARRFLALDGRLRPLPTSPEDLSTSRVLSFGAKLRLLAEVGCARDEALDGSIADFARHRFGTEALERVVEPLVGALHAGDPERLSLRACFPEIARMVAEHGSVTQALKARASAGKKASHGAAGARPCRPAGGMESLPAALAEALGPRLVLGTPVRALTPTRSGWCAQGADGSEHAATQVVLALPLQAARTLLSGPAPGAARALLDMQAEDLVSVVHAYRRADVAHPLDGSGFLVPASAGELSLGTLFCTTIDPSCAPAGTVLLRTLAGGALRPATNELDDATLCARIQAESGALLGIEAQPLFAQVTRYPASIPRFDLAHPARCARLEAEMPPGLFLLGNFLRFLDLERLVSAARALAATL